MKHLANLQYSEVKDFLVEKRESWGDQVHIGPPHPDSPGNELIGVYLDEAAIFVGEAC